MTDSPGSSTTVRRAFLLYFAAVGLLLHLLLAGLFLLDRELLLDGWRVSKRELAGDWPVREPAQGEPVADPAWRPLTPSDHSPPPAGRVLSLGQAGIEDLAAASKALRDGDTLHIPAGRYRQGFRVTADNVTVRGIGHVVLDDAAVADKAAIVVRGNGAVIENIECRNIAVPDGNGACVRLSGRDLLLRHVYFHSSQQGLLTGRNSGRVRIMDSRFENLGYRGRAHAIYAGGDELRLEHSQVLASTSEGHEVKSRARRTVIRHSVIASLAAPDSRLLDISDGGELLVEYSVLQQGPASRNRDAIGFALERRGHRPERIRLNNNIIILERAGENRLLRHPPDLRPSAQNNLFVAGVNPVPDGTNVHYTSRAEAGLPPFPQLPEPPSPQEEASP